MIGRCGDCFNCRVVEQTKGKVLGATQAAIARREAVSDEWVMCWNNTLRDYPCEGLRGQPTRAPWKQFQGGDKG